MPRLPDASVKWPPANSLAVREKFEEWNAWLSGDPDELTQVYGNSVSTVNLYPHRTGGIRNRIRDWWWGTKQSASHPYTRVHVPLPADICRASADLLFSSPPTFISEDEETQKQLQKYLDYGIIDVLAGAANTAAALGGTYLKVSYANHHPHSFVSVIDADDAYPIFRYGSLSEVTFAWIVEINGSKVTRHLERHYTLPATTGVGVGMIEHALYEGEADKLGRRLGLHEHPDTENITVDGNSEINTGTPGLSVVYVPNRTPNPLWRKDPFGANLGASDFVQLEPSFDQLDKAMSGWVRDLDKTRPRVVVPSEALVPGKPGQGASYDMDQELFVGLGTRLAPVVEGNKSMPIEVLTFPWTFDAPKATVEALESFILRAAGYSPATFGEDSEGAQMTATEVSAKDKASRTTRERKLRIWQPALEKLLRKMLLTDLFVFKAAVKPETVSVIFPQAITTSDKENAETAKAQKEAGASLEQRVRTQHPTWDDKQVMEELGRIKAEQPAPDQFTQDPNDPGKKLPVEQTPVVSDTGKQ